MNFGKYENFGIGGKAFSNGGRYDLELKVSESFASNPTSIPITVIKGHKPGPVLLITAAIHGDELNGIEIVRALINTVDPDKLKGIMVCVPVVNIYGFQNTTRYLPDGYDLNRYFPGDMNNWSQGRYAYIVFNEIVKKCDYLIDLHTASNGRSNLPHVRGDISHPEVKKMALAFGTTVIMDYEGAEGSLRKAALEESIPSIILEAGESRKFEKKVAERGLYGVLNVVKSLNMLAGDPEQVPYHIVVKKTTWIRADRGGILSIKTMPGKIVRKGKVIATNTNPFGTEIEKIKAPYSGIVIGIATAPTVLPGQGICHLFKIEEPVKEMNARLLNIFGKKRVVF